MLVAFHVPPGVLCFPSKEEDTAPEASPFPNAAHRDQSFRLQSDSRYSERIRGGARSRLPCDVYCKSGEEVFAKVAQPLLHALLSLNRDERRNAAKDGMLVFDDGIRQRGMYYPQKYFSNAKGSLQRAPGREVFISSCRWLLEFSGTTDIYASAVLMKESCATARNILVDLLADEPTCSFPNDTSISRRQSVAPTTVFKDGEEETSIFGSRVLPILSLVHAQKVFALCFSLDPVRTGSASESDTGEGAVVITLRFSFSQHSVNKEKEEREEEKERERRTVLHEQQQSLPQRALHFIWLPSLLHSAHSSLDLTPSSPSLPAELHLGLHRECVHQAASCLATPSSSLLPSFPILRQCWRKSMVCALLKPFLLGQQPGAWVTSLSCVFYPPCRFSIAWSLSPIIQEIISLSHHIYASRHHTALGFERSRSHSPTPSSGEGEQAAPFLFPFLLAESNARTRERTPPWSRKERDEREVNDPTAWAPDDAKAGEENEKMTSLRSTLKEKKAMTKQRSPSLTEGTRRSSVTDDERKQSTAFRTCRSHLSEKPVPLYPQDSSTFSDKESVCNSSNRTSSSRHGRRSRDACKNFDGHPNRDISCRSAATFSSSSTVLAQQRLAGMQELKRLSQCNRRRVQQRQEEELSFWHTVNRLFHPFSFYSPASYALTGSTAIEENNNNVGETTNEIIASSSLEKKANTKGAGERVKEAVLVSKNEGNLSFLARDVPNRDAHQASFRRSVPGSRVGCAASPCTPRFSFSPFRFSSLSKEESSARHCAVAFPSSRSWTVEEGARWRDDYTDSRKEEEKDFLFSIRARKKGQKEECVEWKKEKCCSMFRDRWRSSTREEWPLPGDTKRSWTTFCPTVSLLHRERLQRPYRLHWQFASTSGQHARERESSPSLSSLALHRGFSSTPALFFSPSDQDSTFPLRRSSSPRDRRESAAKTTGKAVSGVFLHRDLHPHPGIETSFYPLRSTVETSIESPPAACRQSHPIEHSRQKKRDSSKDLYASPPLSSKSFHGFREEKKAKYFSPTYQDFLNIKPQFKLKHCAKAP